MLGVPDGEANQLREWIDLSLHREPGQMEPTREGREAIMQVGAYYYQLIAEKRRNPGDDMLSRLTQVTVDRGDGVESGLEDVEITGFATLLGGAGAETVTKLIGNAAVLFDRNPEQWQRVRDEPEVIPRAVEEILRLLPPSQYQGRFSKVDREFEGGTIPAGYPVLLLTGAATRDPRAFERPDELDLDRPPSVAIGFAGSTCRTWPATRTCRSAPSADGAGRQEAAGTSMTTAVDMPPPAHMAATPVPPPRRRSSWVSEMTMRAPVMATG
jgi:cytochrome P450